ncbi:MAG: hypothetical protein K2X87_23285 [Gemmataceae bacterium]|nr:hypothetical protein [Gemmataceae bacterium]
MSIDVTDPQTAAALAATTAPAEVRGPDGRVLGRFVPAKPPAPDEPLVPWDPTITREELDRRLAEPGLTIDEVRERLGWKK